jgi:hypothetical protein
MMLLLLMPVKIRVEEMLLLWLYLEKKWYEVRKNTRLYMRMNNDRRLQDNNRPLQDNEGPLLDNDRSFNNKDRALDNNNRAL